MVDERKFVKLSKAYFRNEYAHIMASYTSPQLGYPDWYIRLCFSSPAPSYLKSCMNAAFITFLSSI